MFCLYDKEESVEAEFHIFQEIQKCDFTKPAKEIGKRIGTVLRKFEHLGATDTASREAVAYQLEKRFNLSSNYVDEIYSWLV